MTYKRYGWLAGMCFLGTLVSGGMTENRKNRLVFRSRYHAALLTVGMVSARASLLLAACEQQKHYRGRYR